MHKTRFHIAAMDCPSEEQLIRQALSSVSGVERLEFDLPDRSLTVWHRDDAQAIQPILERLELGARLVGTEESSEQEAQAGVERDQTGVLRLLLAINAVMFVVEIVAGWLGESTGLLSDALDMFADAVVYGVALWAVGRTASSQRLAARLSGWLQMMLACGVLFEVARRAVLGSEPEAPMMIGAATLALIANVTCVLALARHRSGGAHMKASWIFSTNDVIANLGVIVAGALVAWTSSSIPDLVIGSIIGLVVMRGAVRILKLSSSREASS
jgi:Co/Zn/Cd efflux system component